MLSFQSGLPVTICMCSVRRQEPLSFVSRKFESSFVDFGVEKRRSRTASISASKLLHPAIASTAVALCAFITAHQKHILHINKSVKQHIKKV